LLLVSARLGDRNILCLLDTGACLSALDVRWKSAVGKFRETRLLQTPAGATRVETFDWPKMTLGGQTLKSNAPLASLDLEGLRRATNEDIRGILGMDVLGALRLQIDFDDGQVRFLESLPEDGGALGTQIPIEFNDDGTPFIAGLVGGVTRERFLIDTGAQGNSLESARFDQSLDRGFIQLGSSFVSLTAAGEARGDRGRLSKLSVGSLSHDNLRFSRTNVSSLGLRYFSRFVVTFDFPQGKAYLRKGEHPLRPEPRATSGMTLHWIQGKPVVESVKAAGPAEAAGLKRRDVLLRINYKDAAEIDPFALRQLLTSEGGTIVPMTVRRAGRNLDVDLVLAPD
jgi:hypothetical protein